MCEKKSVEIIFVYPDGSKKVCNANVGDNMLQVIRKNHIPMACSCGGALACGSCHGTLDQPFFDKIEDSDQAMSETEEETMEYFVNDDATDTSRLCCQVDVREELNGMHIYIPKNTSD
ncbi:2Fe-2S iron-sulfur cluster-binding protein [Candidatus Nesciobacter abundans]|uniref:2Fe-2S ferredoxin-type domain-containing protein n=1 Tax=Candidatus Nesciobacter abundans TaxID=2601668 RepID=A0A5C0UFQ2_9PROT|nr:2Fe-2S iron-sulfur cluster-binding protein [Candidatus Nesciobacter abundans]QEK38888.1 hypothetical protein FZC36_00335 [Candidatus Nesciobacter abundans]